MPLTAIAACDTAVPLKRLQEGAFGFIGEGDWLEKALSLPVK